MTNVDISCLGAIFVVAMTYDLKTNTRSSSNTRYHTFAGLHKTGVPFTDDFGSIPDFMGRQLDQFQVG